MYDTQMDQNRSRSNFYPANDNISMTTPNHGDRFKRRNSKVSRNQPYFDDNIS